MKKLKQIWMKMVFSIKNNYVIARSEVTKQSVYSYLARLLHPDKSGLAMTIFKSFLEKLNDDK